MNSLQLGNYGEFLVQHFYFKRTMLDFKIVQFLIWIYSYSQKYFAFLKYINFKEKMLREGIILKYFSYILINITRGTQI